MNFKQNKDVSEKPTPYRKNKKPKKGPDSTDDDYSKKSIESKNGTNRSEQSSCDSATAKETIHLSPKKKKIQFFQTVLIPKRTP